MTWQGTESLSRRPWSQAEHARARTMIPGFNSIISLDINTADDWAEQGWETTKQQRAARTF